MHLILVNSNAVYRVAPVEASSSNENEHVRWVFYAKKVRVYQMPVLYEECYLV